MADIVKEMVNVTNAGSGLLRIQHTQVHGDGIDMGGSLVFDAGAAGWLADRVDDAVQGRGPAEVDDVRGDDHFTVYVGGSEMQPFVHVHNQRAPSAPQGQVYALGMTASTAATLATLLRSKAAG